MRSDDRRSRNPGAQLGDRRPKLRGLYNSLDARRLQQESGRLTIAEVIQGSTAGHAQPSDAHQGRPDATGDPVRTTMNQDGDATTGRALDFHDAAFAATNGFSTIPGSRPFASIGPGTAEEIRRQLEELAEWAGIVEDVNVLRSDQDDDVREYYEAASDSCGRLVEHRNYKSLNSNLEVVQAIRDAVVCDYAPRSQEEYIHFEVAPMDSRSDQSCWVTQIFAIGLSSSRRTTRRPTRSNAVIGASTARR